MYVLFLALSAQSFLALAMATCAKKLAWWMKTSSNAAARYDKRLAYY
jgi:uncharacterized membrane protein YdfJ with MMPL/SSD domain